MLFTFDTAHEIRADLIFAALRFEREMIQRAVRKEIGTRAIPVASLEDLVLMKLISEREKDQTDARQPVRSNRESVDLRYLEPRLKELADGLDRPEILQVFRDEPGAEY